MKKSFTWFNEVIMLIFLCSYMTVSFAQEITNVQPLTEQSIIFDGDNLKYQAANLDIDVEDKIGISHEYVVYPNPFDSYVKISNVVDLSSIIITNVAGKRVIEIDNPYGIVSTDELKSGLYFITLIKDGVVVKTERIVKK